MLDYQFPKITCFSFINIRVFGIQSQKYRIKIYDAFIVDYVQQCNT